MLRWQNLHVKTEKRANKFRANFLSKFGHTKDRHTIVAIKKSRHGVYHN